MVTVRRPSRLRNVETARRLVQVALVLIGASLAWLGASVALAQSSPTAEEACLPGTPVATPTSAEEPSADRCVTVGMFDIYYDPNLVTLPSDTSIRAALRNDGQALHNFSVTDHNNADVENLAISFDVQPGETKSVELDAPAGTYYFFCNQPGHEQAGMFGYLEVEAGAVIATAVATNTPPAQ